MAGLWLPHVGGRAPVAVPCLVRVKCPAEHLPNDRGSEHHKHAAVCARCSRKRIHSEEGGTVPKWMNASLWLAPTPASKALQFGALPETRPPEGYGPLLDHACVDLDDGKGASSGSVPWQEAMETTAL